MRRRTSKATDVYERPAAGTTLQTSGRRIPLRPSDAPDYEAVSVSEIPRAHRGIWLVVTLLVLAGLCFMAWRTFA